MESRPENSLTARWFLQSTLGVLLLVLLGVHLVVNHWVAPSGLLSYADVIDYYDLPGIVWMEIIFLIVVTTHCLMGMHAMLLDLSLSAPTLRVLTWMLFVMGLVITVYGIRLIWVVANV